MLYKLLCILFIKAMNTMYILMGVTQIPMETRNIIVHAFRVPVIHMLNYD